MMDENLQLEHLQYSQKSIADYMSAFKRRKYKLLLICISLIIIVTLVTILLPAVYKSSAIILIEQQEIPQDFVRTTVTSYADQRIQIISQRVMTTSNMKSIIDKYDLYAEDRKKEPLEAIFEQMREDVSLDMISADIFDPRTGRAAKATIAFSLAYINESPKLAQNVANELVSLFLNENLKNRTEMAEEANQFLQDEVDRLGARVNLLETKVAEFKEDNASSLPEMSQLNRELMTRHEAELAEVIRKIQILKERDIYLQSELLQLSPYQATISESGERILSPRDRLKILETKLISLTTRYSDQHPDVIKTKKEIDALRTETGDNSSKKEIAMRLKEARLDLVSLKEKYSDSHPEVKKSSRLVLSLEDEIVNSTANPEDKLLDETPDNPAYIQIKTQLDAAQSEMLSLKQREKDLKQKLSLYEDRLTKSPKVEREFRALLREYENELLKFKEIKAKQMEAQLAENLEIEKKGERFTLIEPPLLPELPDSPNRKLLLLLGFILSIGAGASSIFLMDSLDNGIYGRKGVEKLIGEMPLTVVPYIETPDEKRKKQLRIMILGLFIFTLLIFVLASVHFFIKPLDVLWFVLLRRFGFA